MIQISVPATSANLGIGFDSMGIALNIYNRFEVEPASEYLLSGFCDDMDPLHNLFLVSYKKACRSWSIEPQPIHAKLMSKVPIARGLGSSSTMIVGGILAANELYHLHKSKEEILKLASEIEGHPDNVAPCIHGGLCINHEGITLRKEVSDKWHFTVLIPDYEVKTEKARAVLKNEISIPQAVGNISAAVIGIDALENFNRENIHVLMDDHIHEPYRKALIKDYAACKKEAMNKGADAFLISGSGSSMLVISADKIDLKFKNIKTVDVHIDKKGALCQNR